MVKNGKEKKSRFELFCSMHDRKYHTADEMVLEM